jgi:2-polyprenyl-3-methyl-5-hydroxy-6-metoxy-1,4-benzoquinol methylase
MGKNIYTNGEYFKKNVGYHVDDSPWKAQQILKMIKKTNLQALSICEIGCGAGEILRQLQLHMPEEIRFYGYDISQQAIELCKERANSRLSFYCDDLLSKDIEPFDILLCIDVVEHIEDYMGFLRKMRKRAKYTIFHFPLDISLQTVIRGLPIIQFREKLGHLHYFTKDTALLTLRDTGYEIIDYFYTPAALDLGKTNLSKIAKLPIKIAAMIDQDLAARIFGAYALLVAAK